MELKCLVPKHIAHAITLNISLNIFGLGLVSTVSLFPKMTLNRCIYTICHTSIKFFCCLKNSTSTKIIYLCLFLSAKLHDFKHIRSVIPQLLYSTIVEWMENVTKNIHICTNFRRNLIKLNKNLCIFRLLFEVRPWVEVDNILNIIFNSKILSFLFVLEQSSDDQLDEEYIFLNWKLTNVAHTQ